MFLWHLLSRPQNELIVRVYQAQKINPTKYDYFCTITEEMERYGIDMTELEIQNMSKRKFRKLVYESVEK